jgi:dihydroorotase-like cyclic amidohydrolase
MSEPAFDRAFVAARAIVDGAERPCVIGVRDGRIAAVLDFDPTHPTESVAAREIVRLADGEVLLPGLVDTHVHINEPGRTDWEGFETGTRAAAAGALAQLRAARADGVDVSVETCPHYLAIVAEAIDDGATQFKCAPPIRDAANCERMWEALLGGEITMIVSDHSPCTADLKRLDTGDFARAWGGIASLELGLPVVWTAARGRGCGLADVARWMATAPADRIGLTYKGRIAVGADADLVVFDPGAEFVVDPSRLQQRNPVSAYAGRRLTGVIRDTWLRGERVGLSSAAPHGRLIERGRRA